MYPDILMLREQIYWCAADLHESRWDQFHGLTNLITAIEAWLRQPFWQYEAAFIKSISGDVVVFEQLTVLLRAVRGATPDKEKLKAVFYELLDEELINSLTEWFSRLASAKAAEVEQQKQNLRNERSEIEKMISQAAEDTRKFFIANIQEATAGHEQFRAELQQDINLVKSQITQISDEALTLVFEDFTNDFAEKSKKAYRAFYATMGLSIAILVAFAIYVFFCHPASAIISEANSATSSAAMTLLIFNSLLKVSLATFSIGFGVKTALGFLSLAQNLSHRNTLIHAMRDIASQKKISHDVRHALVSMGGTEVFRGLSNYFRKVESLQSVNFETPKSKK